MPSITAKIKRLEKLRAIQARLPAQLKAASDAVLDELFSDPGAATRPARAKQARQPAAKKRRKRGRITPGKISKIAQDMKDGVPIAKTAKAVGVHYQTVLQQRKRLNAGK